MEGVYSCVFGRSCRTRDDTRVSVKVVRTTTTWRLRKRLSHTILMYSKAESQPSYDLHKQGLLAPLQGFSVGRAIPADLGGRAV